MSDSDLQVNEGTVESGITSFLDKNKSSVAIFLFGMILIGLGVFLNRQGYLGESDKVEIINSDVSESSSVESGKTVVVEISGGVEKPGVYKLQEGSRIEDLLIISGGISADADRQWVEKYINRAAKLSDGQKLYIMKLDDQSNGSSARDNTGIKPDQVVLGVDSSGLININTASLSELDTLPGIGQVYGKSIIDHRPYSDVSQLLSKEALKQNVYDKIKDRVTVY